MFVLRGNLPANVVAVVFDIVLDQLLDIAVVADSCILVSLLHRNVAAKREEKKYVLLIPPYNQFKAIGLQQKILRY